MKRFFSSVLSVLMLAAVGCGEAFDDSLLWERINDHEKRIALLEELCKQMNTNISALQTIVTALQDNDYATGVAPITKEGETVGYTITFSKSDPITIYHGKDGHTPQIGVKPDTDNNYYWTLDGEWLLDSSGNKIQAQGITPKLKVEDDYWHISYDNGATWEQLGKATGEDGDSFFKNVTANDDYVIFTLADGTELVVPRNAQISGNKIYYTTTNGEKIYPTSSDPAKFGAILMSNIYKNGQGVLTFNDTITSIGAKAFYGYETLTSITIPDNVTKIGVSAFYECTSLTSITIPDSVTKIGGSAFCDCIGELIINSKIVETDYRSSWDSGNDTPLYPTYDSSGWLYGEMFTKLTIGDNVKKIGSHVFNRCNNLESVTIGNSVTKIGNNAFVFCSSLTSVTIPNSVTSIGREAFDYCSSLKEVYCKPTTPPAGGDLMFDRNASGRKIYVPRESVNAYKTAEGWKDYADAIVGYDF